MVYKKNRRLAREDWLRAALHLCDKGIDRVKIAPLAAGMGVTSGSFYWHFRNRGELLDALQQFWEREMTDGAIAAAKAFEGKPLERIRFTMEHALNHRLSRYDFAFWQWSQSDTNAKQVYGRVLKKRLEFATQLFMETGFSRAEAQTRGRMMVVCMLGELTLTPESESVRRDRYRLQYAILTNPGYPVTAPASRMR